MICAMLLDPKQKPDPSVCPKQFCFHWRSANDSFRERIRLENCLLDAEGDCMNPVGICIRFDAAEGDHDAYEPDEPDLRDAGLPWFYFISSPANLRRDFRQKYISESEVLWGKEHWKARERSDK